MNNNIIAPYVRPNVAPGIVRHNPDTLAGILCNRNANDQAAKVNAFPVIQSLTMESAFAGVSLSALKRDDPAGLALALKRLMEWVGDLLNLATPFSELQMAMWPGLLIAEFPATKLEEVALAFRQGCAGEYGRHFTRLDISHFCEWVRTYQADERIEQLRYKKQTAQYLAPPPPAQSLEEDVAQRLAMYAPWLITKPAEDKSCFAITVYCDENPTKPTHFSTLQVQDGQVKEVEFAITEGCIVTKRQIGVSKPSEPRTLRELLSQAKVLNLSNPAPTPKPEVDAYLKELQNNPDYQAQREADLQEQSRLETEARERADQYAQKEAR
jgi:hypothetical protein